MTDLVRPDCGCPHVEIEHRGLTLDVHIEPAGMASLYVHDFDSVHDLSATDLVDAIKESRAVVDAMLAAKVQQP